MIYLSSKKEKGFTLVEMIISLGIFSVVAVVALGALIRIISANRKAQTLQTALTNLNFSLESMARELRVGDGFHCDTSMGSYDGADPTFRSKGCNINNDVTGDIDQRDTTVIAFRSWRRDPNGNDCNLATVYEFTGTPGDYNLEKGEQSGCPGSPVTTSDMQPILDLRNIKLTNYRLGVGPNTGATLTSSYPYLFIRLEGYAGERERDKTFFDIQTAVSARTPQN